MRGQPGHSHISISVSVSDNRSVAVLNLDAGERWVQEDFAHERESITIACHHLVFHQQRWVNVTGFHSSSDESVMALPLIVRHLLSYS